MIPKDYWPELKEEYGLFYVYHRNGILLRVWRFYVWLKESR